MSAAERLREERARIGATQDELAAAGGVKKLTQISYEKGRSAPDTDYLAAVSAVGVDAAYIVTGVRGTGTPTSEIATRMQTVRVDVVRMATATLCEWLDRNELHLPAQPMADAVVALCEIANTPEEVVERAPPVLRLVMKMAA